MLVCIVVVVVMMMMAIRMTMMSLCAPDSYGEDNFFFLYELHRKLSSP